MIPHRSKLRNIDIPQIGRWVFPNSLFLKLPFRKPMSRINKITLKLFKEHPRIRLKLATEMHLICVKLLNRIVKTHTQNQSQKNTPVIKVALFQRSCKDWWLQIFRWACRLDGGGIDPLLFACVFLGGILIGVILESNHNMCPT